MTFVTGSLGVPCCLQVEPGVSDITAMRRRKRCRLPKARYAWHGKSTREKIRTQARRRGRGLGFALLRSTRAVVGGDPEIRRTRRSESSSGNSRTVGSHFEACDGRSDSVRARSASPGLYQSRPNHKLGHKAFIIGLTQVETLITHVLAIREPAEKKRYASNSLIN